MSVSTSPAAVKPGCAEGAVVRSHDEGFAALRDRLAGAADARGHARTAGALERLAYRPDTDGTTDLPVLGWLDDALARAVEDVDTDLAEALGALARGARWRQTASYVERPPTASFLDRYGHCGLAPGGPRLPGLDPRRADARCVLLTGVTVPTAG